MKIPASLAIAALTTSASALLGQTSADLLGEANKAYEANRLDDAVALAGKAVAKDDQNAAAYNLRGLAQFKLGKITESIKDFDKAIELEPKRKAGHWQRGISYYYAGRYKDGKEQFEGYQEYDSNDVENGVWRFMCMARMKDIGIDKARKDMLKIGPDKRVPMRQVYDLFAGKLKPADVFAAVHADEPDLEVLRGRLFYAHLYVGIHYDLAGEKSKALEHLEKAAADYRSEHYMGDVARIHRDVLKADLKKKTDKK